jgi:hypothetical protein
MTVFLSPLAPELRQINGFVPFLPPRLCKGTKIVIFFRPEQFPFLHMQLQK